MTWGRACPVCGELGMEFDERYDREPQLLSTTNEWKNYCPVHDIRYNDDGIIRPADTWKLSWPSSQL